MPQPNFYRVLDVSPHATLDEIKVAYRELARRYHPDTGSREASGQIMQAINTAYAILSDPLKRRVYDRARGADISPKLLYEVSIVPLNLAPDQYINTDFGIYVRTNDPEIVFFASRWKGTVGTIDVYDGIILVTHRDNSYGSEPLKSEVDKYLRGILKRRKQEKIISRRVLYLALAQIDDDKNVEVTKALHKFLLDLDFVALGNEYIHTQDLMDVVRLFVNGEYDEAKRFYGSDSLNDWMKEIASPE